MCAQESFDTVIIGALIGLHQQWRVDPTAIDIDRSLTALKTLLRANEANE